MKTLNRTLSLALVFALVFSLMSFAFADTTTTTTTTTTGYTDAAKITYKEAVAVTSAIGVINGMDNGAFDPTGTLTREQGAKIIAYMMLGSTNAQSLATASTQTFTDVAKNRWSAGYIQYCVNAGILAGYGDGTFGPTDQLTSCAWAKMLLVALGYNADNEGFTGKSWAINVAADAVKAGINDSDIALSADTKIDREQACQMAFLTLSATAVQYSGGSTVTTSDGTKVVVGAVRSNVTNGAATETIDDDNLMQFAEVHFPKLTLSTTGTGDAYGRPANTWKNGVTTVGKYANKAAIVKWTDDHTATTKDTTVAKAVADYTFAASVAIYKNGEPTTDDPFTAAKLAALTGNGVDVEVYATSGVINRVVVVNTVLAKCINKDTANKTITLTTGTASVTLKSTSDTDAYGNAYTAAYNTMSVGDAVLAVVNESGTAVTKILSYSVPTVVSGVITGKTAGTTTNTNVYTIGGKTYQAGNGASAALLDSLTLGTQAYRFVIDSYGYIKFADTNTSAAQTYAFVLDTSRDGSAMAGYTYNAKLLMGDGSTKWVKMASYAGSTDETILTTALTSTKNNFVPYTANTDGSYAIGTLVAADSLAGKVVTNSNATFNTKLVSGTTTFLIYNSTTKTYTPYTGVANVPTTNITTGYGLLSTGVYKFVVITDSTATSADVVYIYDTTATDTSYVNSTTVDTYDALVNGTLSTVKAVHGQIASQGIMVGSQYASGVISTAGTDSAAVNALNSSLTLSKTVYATNPVQKVALTAQNITLNDGVLTVANGNGAITGLVSSNFTCYVTSAGGSTCTVKSLSSTAYSATGTLYLVLDSNGYVAYAILAVA